MDILFLLLGLVLILFGANALTDGSASVAKRFRISNLVIGLTIVASGTSAPELVVSLFSALKGSTDLSIGNVLGSNVFNMLAIVGCTALVAPITVGKGTISKEIPLCVLASLALLFCASDQWLDAGEVNVIGRSEGLTLLCFFAIFMRYTFAIAHSDEQDSLGTIKELGMVKSVLLILLGLAGLIVGGQMFVQGASGIARSLGVSESIIGLTLVAGGTSLPELATSMVAAWKGNSGIAIGNVIGSCLFNIFFVLGCSAMISPLYMKGITGVDMVVLVASSVLLWLTAVFFRKRTVTRPEGGLLVLAYVAYMSYLIVWQ